MKDDKQIVVPSFGTTGALFARHFDILSRLKRRIYLLQQAYENQQDEERSKILVEEILKTLTKGIHFLNFDDVGSSKASSSIRRDPAADDFGQGKKFYEDPTLVQDEQKMKEVMEEKQKVEEMLRPKAIEIDSAENVSAAAPLDTNPGTAAGVEDQEIKETDEKNEEEEK